MSIYRKAVNNPVTTALIFIAMAIFGVFSLIQISLDRFPKFDANVIMVMSSYPGASAEDIETNLTKVLENSLNGVSDLKDIISTSKENISLITLKFVEGVDIDVATNDVRDKLDMVNSVLPDGASLPLIFKFSADDMPIMIMAATANESLHALEKILDDKVATPLARVSGVGTVSVAGAPQREIQVYCDPNKLEAYGLTVAGISSIIASENRNVPSGSIDIGSNSYALRVEKEFTNAEQMLDIVVGHFNGKTIYLRDVARVVDGIEERYQEAYVNGIPGAQIIIQKQADANAVNVIRGVKKEMKKIEKNLPSDIEIRTVMDSSDNILNTLNSLKETILVTFLIVMLVVYLFLGRWRATFIIVLAIPISLLASLMYLWATGNTLNIVSMSALSIAIGMVVDDAIVVLENISTHLERGAKPKEAAVHATQEVGISVIASTLTMLAVFMPLTMIKGMAGVMFKQLGWITSIIMIVSTIGALTLIPMLCSQFLRFKPKTGKLHDLIFGNFNKFIDLISRGYARLISWCIGHRMIVGILSIAVFAATVGILGPKIKTDFFPSSDQGRITLQLELPAGTGQDITRELAHEIHKKFVAQIPEIVNCSYALGQADTDNAFASMQTNGTHVVSYNVNIGSMEDRERSQAEIADVIRAILADYPEFKKVKVTEGGGGMGGGASTVDVEIYGYDFEVTDRVAKLIQEGMLAKGGCSQVLVSRDEYTPEYQVDFDREKLAINGLNTTTAAAYFSAAMNGSTQSFYREDGDEYDIRVRYAPEFRTSIEDIENIIIYNNMGKGVKIKDLGTVVETLTPPSIQRKNRERMITVSGVVANGVALSDAVAMANEVIEQTDIPSELYVRVGGSFEDQQDMFADLILLLAMIIILVYIVMASQFESFMSPFVIMFSIPFAFVGVLMGLYVTGTPLGAMGMIGILILMGIVVKNGIVLIDYTILMRERGHSVTEASTIAANSRLRPILMTTLTTVLGMIPMAVGQGEGSEMWRSLGMVVAWGLSISTLVTLVIIPTLYAAMASWQERRAARKAAQKA
ncbi:MAG: efflux RND transporter permease subunit [Bacteroidales bacterium]|nr:efflux RND transporter permease subunit [Bacteroidales bacterium]MBQ5603694.1 efflux RND transporter permease subunit [Bacteroidales bacterium]